MPRLNRQTITNSIDHAIARIAEINQIITELESQETMIGYCVCRYASGGTAFAGVAAKQDATHYARLYKYVPASESPTGKRTARNVKYLSERDAARYEIAIARGKRLTNTRRSLRKVGAQLSKYEALLARHDSPADSTDNGLVSAVAGSVGRTTTTTERDAIALKAIASANATLADARHAQQATDAVLERAGEVLESITEPQPQSQPLVLRGTEYKASRAVRYQIWPALPASLPADELLGQLTTFDYHGLQRDVREALDVVQTAHKPYQDFSGVKVPGRRQTKRDREAIAQWTAVAEFFEGTRQRITTEEEIAANAADASEHESETDYVRSLLPSYAASRVRVRVS